MVTVAVFMVSREKEKKKKILKAEMGKSDSRHLECCRLPRRRIIHLLPIDKYVIVWHTLLKT